MNIFVKCPGCKSNYSFVEEPADGRLRFPVSCTNCGVDGTNEANEYIRKFHLGELQKEQEKKKAWWHRFTRKDDDDDYVLDPQAKETEEKEPSTLLGVVGACVGGLLGMLLWYGFVIWTGWELGYVAWAVGILAGAGARVVVRGGNFTMAAVAATCALVAILAGQVLVLRSMVQEEMDEVFKGSYGKVVAFAKEAVSAKGDDDFRKLMTKYPNAMNMLRNGDALDEVMGKSGSARDKTLRSLGIAFMEFDNDQDEAMAEELAAEAAKMVPLTNEELVRFRKVDFPVLQDLAGGKVSEKEFNVASRGDVVGQFSTQEQVMQSWSPYSLLWIFLGVGSAYKLAYNKSETEDI